MYFVSYDVMMGYDVGWVPTLVFQFRDFGVVFFCKTDGMTQIISFIICYIYFWGSDDKSEELL